MIEKWFDHQFSWFFKDYPREYKNLYPADHLKNRPKSLNINKNRDRDIWPTFFMIFQGLSTKIKKIDPTDDQSDRSKTLKIIKFLL